MADQIPKLEVDHGGDPGHQQQEQRDHQQIARFEQQHEAVEGIAAETLVHARSLGGSCRWPASLRFSASSMRTIRAVIANPAAEISSSVLAPTDFTKNALKAGATIVPTVPPAAMKPNSRFACELEKMSAIMLQNTEMMSRLSVLSQT